MKRELKGYVVYDFETTTTTYMGRKASPFSSENWVVAAAYIAQANAKAGVVGTYWGEDKLGSKGWLKTLLEAYWPQFLVGFNIKFDLLHATLAEEDLETYMEWVAAGGQLWDGQLAEYLLDGMVPESHMLSLDEVSPKYGGEVKIDEVKAMWAAGINTHEIPKQLLMDYLTGRDGKGGDILNTELVFLGQLKAAKKAGQIKSILLNMGALVASTEMERNGLNVNIELGRQQAKALKEQSDSLMQSLTTYLPKDLPFEFNWRSRAQLSALIFGGSVKYKQRIHQTDTAGNLLYAMMDEEHALLNAPSEKDLQSWPLSKIEADMANGKAWNVQRYSGGKKAGMIKTRRVKVPDKTKPKLKWEDFLWPLKGFTKPKPQWAGSEPGVYSTKAEVIEELGDRGIPFLEDLAKLGSILKDLGTYYITEEFDDDGNVTKAKGMLTLVQPDNIVHHSVNHTTTVTGRLSHNNPNMGNLPREDTSDVKTMFTSRWGEQGNISSSDFSSLEVYCQANLSNDKTLVQHLREGLDMHVMRLSTVENMPYKEVLVLAKGGKGPDGTKIHAVHEWVVKRKDIKTFSFQRAYGAGADKISREVKKPKELVEQWIEADKAMYPGVVAWDEKVEQIVTSSRIPTMKFARHPNAKVQVQLGRGKARTWDGKLYVWTEKLTPEWLWKQRGKLSSFSPTELKNYMVQGLGGEWMKAAMWLAVRAFYHYRNFEGKALLVNTVHDALYNDSHKSATRKAAIVMHAAMLAASDYMEWRFEHTVNVPVPTETSYGPSMAVEEHFEDEEAFNAAVTKVRTWLRAKYMDNYTPSYLKGTT